MDTPQTATGSPSNVVPISGNPEEVGNPGTIPEVTAALVAKHTAEPEQPRRRGRPPLARPVVAAGQESLAADAGQDAGDGGAGAASPADLELLQRTISVLLTGADEIIGGYIERLALKIIPDKAEVKSMVDSRALPADQTKLLSEQGAILAAQYGLNSRNMPALVCGAMLTIYAVNNARTIAELKKLASRRPAPPPNATA